MREEGREREEGSQKKGRETKKSQGTHTLFTHAHSPLFLSFACGVCLFLAAEVG